MYDYYVTAYAIALGAFFLPSAILYVVLRHYCAGRTSGNDGWNRRDRDGL